MAKSRKASIDKLIEPFGVEIVRNTRGGTYFWFAPLRDDAPDIPSVYVFRFGELTDDQWLEHVRSHSTEGTNR